MSSQLQSIVKRQRSNFRQTKKFPALTIEVSLKQEHFLIKYRQERKQNSRKYKIQSFVPFVLETNGGATSWFDGVDFTSPSSFPVVLSP
jgi:hypothetical protein